MIIAIPQLNYKAGDIQGNSEKIISAIQKAQNQKVSYYLFIFSFIFAVKLRFLVSK